jgi:hypothetical protein
MASVDATVRTLISTFPELTSSRTEALHFLLCVLGNGYQWVDGEVVSTSAPYPLWTEGDVEKQLLVYSSPVIADLLRPALLERQAAAREVINNLDERVQLRVEFLDGPLYPASDSTLLSTIPEDVTADWREACDEMLDLIRRTELHQRN